MSVETESEKTFERYLDSQNLAWTRFPDIRQKHPDYKVEHGQLTCVFEIKEFEDPAIKPVGGFSPCPAIQEKITQARKQFKGYREKCCVLVLWNSKSIYRSVLPDVVASAAFGQYVVTDANSAANLRADPPKYQFSGPAELSPTHNTTISAIAILSPYRLNHLWLETWRILYAKHQRGEEITPWLQFEVLEQLSTEQAPTFSYEGTIRTVVVENPYARIPFPTDLFAGPFDQRWRMQSGWLSLAFMGSELTKLKQSSVPFIYL
ncbi:MAG: hypothetical protein LAN84_01240 [Acidobacteriia bacterium]|nr:hypothetical protein [Terriglobia bacterium]